MNPKKNVSLIFGIAIPIFMILLIAVSIYLPALFAPDPQFDFIYVVGDYSYPDPLYTVDNGKLIKLENKEPKQYRPRIAKLFIYDVSERKNREISFEEAQQLNIDAQKESPDGYQAVYGNENYGFFPFFFGGSSDYNSMYLKGHGASKKLNLQSLDYGRYYYHKWSFIGWIRREG